MVSKPLIVIDPHMNAYGYAGRCRDSVSVGGRIEVEGTAYRMDHVPLPLKKVVEPPKGILSDEEILTRILKEVKKIKSKTAKKTEA